MKRAWEQHSVLIAVLVGVVILFSILSPTGFMSWNNIQTVLFQVPEFGLLTLGMMMVILTGGINLAISSISALSGIIAAFVMVRSDLGMGTYATILAAVLAAMAAAAAMGAASGYIVAFIGVSPILVTLGMKILLEGVCMRLTKGGSISGYPEEFYFLGSGAVAKIPVPILIFALAAVIAHVLLNRTPWGMKMCMTGSNRTASQFSGIDVKKALLQAYVYSSIMAGIASMIMISRYNSAKVTLGSSYLLQSISAAVLGGTDMAGGRGSVLGTMIAICIIQVISNGLNILGTNRFITDAIMGVILVSVLVLSRYSQIRGSIRPKAADVSAGAGTGAEH
ncbi:MAG: ABC transporter permease [Clostridia bacterium]|nr:ABC transporter permease [Clostridia bacterium]